MRTVADLISANESLRVTCRNCDREGYFTARFLKARLGYTGNVLEGRYRCSKCRSFNVSLCMAAAEAGEKQLQPMTHFHGVYAKHED